MKGLVLVISYSSSLSLFFNLIKLVNWSWTTERIKYIVVQQLRWQNVENFSFPGIILVILKALFWQKSHCKLNMCDTCVIYVLYAAFTHVGLTTKYRMESL